MSHARRFARWSLPFAALLAVVLAGCAGQGRCGSCNHSDWPLYGQVLRGAGEMPCSPCGTDWCLYSDVLRGDMPCMGCPRPPVCKPCSPDRPECIPCPESQAYGLAPGARK
jgi:hypothetical protein